MTPPPQRRENDQERRRWNDQALDQLAARVETVEDEINIAQALSGLPERVADLKDDIKDLRADNRDASGLEERRIASVRKEIGELRGLVVGLPASTARAVRKGVDWPTVTAVAGTISVPIIIALIAVLKG